MFIGKMVSNMPKKGKIKNRIGERGINNFGNEMIIVNQYQKYNTDETKVITYIDIYFPKYNCIIYKETYSHFNKGHIKCPYEPRVYGVGYLGEGEYSFLKNKNIYDKWVQMLKRCYDDNYLNKNKSYLNVKVCEEWHNFQNFAKWYEENYYEIEGEKMQLDKDILVKGNKIYSPSTCIFVPQRINNLFEIKNKSNSLPLGVSKHGNKFRTRIDNKYSSFDTVEEAFEYYKTYKENLIKQVADEYKPYIPQKLYKIMYNYKIEEEEE